MGKKFKVEVQFKEKSNSENVINDFSMGIILEKWMEGFVATNSIDNEYSINVEEIENDNITDDM